MAPAGQATMGLRERRRVATRTAVMEAAVRLFAEQGYDETTVEQIAAAADISPATFFRHFGSKHEVVFARTTERAAVAEAAVVARPEGESDLEAATRAVSALLHADTQDPVLDVLQQRAVQSTPVLRGRAMDVQTEVEEAIARALATRGGRRAPDREMRLMARLVGALVRHARTEWFEAGAAGRPADLFDEAAAALLHPSPGSGQA